MLGPMRWGPGGGRSRVSWAVLDWMWFRGFEYIFLPFYASESGCEGESHIFVGEYVERIQWVDRGHSLIVKFKMKKARQTSCKSPFPAEKPFVLPPSPP